MDPSETPLFDRFAAIVGPSHALRDGAEIAPFLSEPRGHWSDGVTPMVLRPGSVAEVSAILKLASATQTGIVPQGGNTGLVGGQTPDRSGSQIVLSLSRLNRIREIDIVSNTVTAEAGVILETLQRAADDVDRIFPLSLGSQGSCQVGGNLSSNAGGTGVLSYGNMRELCLGVEIVLPTGEVLDDLRKLKKDNTGYDLKNLFIGAEGTLGVVTAAVLKLFPKPKGCEVAWVAVDSPAAALELFSRAQNRAGSGLTGFELVADIAMRFASLHIAGNVRPLDGWPWYVLVEISSGRSAEDARGLIEQILSEGLEAGFVQDAVIAASLAQVSAFWRLRESLSDAQRPEGASIKHDISVPVASIPAFIDEAGKAVATISPAARVVCFGHMGDGNLHYNISQPVGADAAEFLRLYRPMNRVVHDIVRAYGGSISAEHGIGRLKRDEFLGAEPPVAIDLMQRIKAVIDPAGIMNPGKLL